MNGAALRHKPAPTTSKRNTRRQRAKRTGGTPDPPIREPRPGFGVFPRPLPDTDLPTAVAGHRTHDHESSTNRAISR